MTQIEKVMIKFSLKIDISLVANSCPKKMFCEENPLLHSRNAS